MTTDDEAETIRQIVSGARERFTILVKAYQSTVFGLVMRQVGNRSTAEDLTQEIFLKAYTHIGKFRGDSSFKTWLVRIALNHMNNHFSSSRYRYAKETESFDPHLHEVGDGEGEGEIMERERKLRVLREALATLPSHYRDSIVLCGLNGLSYVEAAEALQIPVGTVRSRLNKARLLLKDHLGGAIQGSSDE